MSNTTKLKRKNTASFGRKNSHRKKHCRGLLQMTGGEGKLGSGSYGSSLGSHINVRNINAGVVLRLP